MSLVFEFMKKRIKRKEPVQLKEENMIMKGVSRVRECNVELLKL